MGETDEDRRPPAPRHRGKIADSLSFALRYDGRRRVHHADDAMARITAERLVEHLARSGFVIMKRPDWPALTARPPHRQAS